MDRDLSFFARAQAFPAASARNMALLVQLRWDFQGNGSDRTNPGTAGLQIPAAELDRLSMSLVSKLTGNRVYSA